VTLPRRIREAEIPVPPQAHGTRCGSFLAERFPGLAPGVLARLFRTRRVKVNGKPVIADRPLDPGDVISLPRDSARRAAAHGGAIPLDILYENAACAVLNKPPGLVMEPGPGHRHGTLRDALLAHYGDSQRALGPGHDFGLVHRLDRDTSGLLLVARSAAAHEALARQFAERRVQKTYLALVSGSLQVGARLLLKDPLTRVRARQGSRIRVGTLHGIPAETVVRPLELFAHGRYTLIEASPQTGRTHQIRVHLAHGGTPILGDHDYGDPMANAQAQRQWGLKRIFLHAQRLRFMDPLTRHVVELEADLPRDLAEVIHRLEEHEHG
jgi:RluA family pseudouridine synthase